MRIEKASAASLRDAGRLLGGASSGAFPAGDAGTVRIEALPGGRGLSVSGARSFGGGEKGLQALLFAAGLSEGIGHRIEAPLLGREDRDAVSAAVMAEPPGKAFFREGAGFGLEEPEPPSGAPEDRLAALWRLYRTSALTVMAPGPGGRPRLMAEENGGWVREFFDFSGRNYGEIECGFDRGAPAIALYVFNPEASVGPEGLNLWGARARIGRGRAEVWEVEGALRAPGALRGEHPMVSSLGAEGMADILCLALPACAASAGHIGPFAAALRGLEASGDPKRFAESAVLLGIAGIEAARAGKGACSALPKRLGPCPGGGNGV